MTRPLPEYCCAILEAPGGLLLMERRPPTAALAARMVTCFGGRREQGEEPEACLRRELREELGWEVGAVERAVVLWKDGRALAWFYLAAAPRPGVALITEEGHEAAWVRRQDAATSPEVSAWHRAAIGAYLCGRGAAEC